MTTLISKPVTLRTAALLLHSLSRHSLLSDFRLFLITLHSFVPALAPLGFFFCCRTNYCTRSSRHITQHTDFSAVAPHIALVPAPRPLASHCTRSSRHSWIFHCARPGCRSFTSRSLKPDCARPGSLVAAPCSLRSLASRCIGLHSSRPSL